MANNVDIAMRAKDEASQAFKSVEQRLNELNAAIDVIKAKGELNLHVKDVANLDKLTKEVNQLERGLAGVAGQGAQTAESLNQSLRGVDLKGIMGGLGLGNLTGLATGAGLAAAAVAVTKTTVEMAQMGAQSLDTKKSFDAVMKSVGEGPGLLNRLDQAAGGTISQLRLMQLTNTALAGSSGEFGAAFGAALPRLIEGARAASQLNPALGDAEFLFNSLVTGIKRGSPMLIDNTGITLKIGEANEAYARSLGKSADALTEEDKKLALINATLSGVDRLVEQAGGNLDSMTSKQQQMKVATDELKTALGELVAKPYTVVVQQITKGVTGAAEFAQGTRAAGAALDTSAGPDAQLAAVEKRLQYLNELRERYRAGENLYRFNPAGNQAEIDSLTRLQEALQRYGGQADEVVAAQTDLQDATAAVSNAQAAYQRAMEGSDAELISLASAALADARAQRDAAQAALDAATAVGAVRTAAADAPSDLDAMGAAVVRSTEWLKEFKTAADAAALAAGTFDQAGHPERAAAFTQQNAGNARWEAMGNAYTQAGQTQAERDAAARNADALRWAGQGDAQVKQQQAVAKETEKAQEKAAKAAESAAQKAATAWESAFQAASSKIQGYLSQASGNAKGLFDLTGGQNDPLAPGSNGAFENLYRALDVAKNGEKSPWAKVLGLDQESAKKISADFQKGLFTADVQKLINIDQVTQQIQGEKAAADSSAKFAELIAKRLGVDDAGKLVASKTFSAIAGNLGKSTDSKEQADVAGQMIGFGQTAFSNFEQGFIAAAEKTDAAAMNKYGRRLYGNIESGFLAAVDESKAFYAMVGRMVEGFVVEQVEQL